MSIETNTDKLSLSIEVLELDLRTYRILNRGNVFTLSDIANLGENGLSGIYQLGKKQVPYVLKKLDDFLSKSEGITLAEIQSKTMPSQFESLDDFNKEPISILKLSGRAANPLLTAGINTIDELLTARNSKYENIRWFGEKAKQEVETALLKFSQSPALPDDPRPFLYTIESSAKPNLVQIIAPFVKVLLNDLKYQYDYEILKRRYGLENSKGYTLQEVGDYFGITRERVRQIAERAEQKIQQTITGAFDTKKWRMPQNIINEAQELFLLLRTYAVLITETEVVKIIQDRYNVTITENELGAVRFLLSLSGLEALPKNARESAGISLVPTWVLLEKIDKPLLFKLVDIVYHILLDEVKPVSRFDIFVQVNRKLKKKVEPIYLDYASKVCQEIEKTDDDHYEFRFESLPSVADKAYRILYQANKPLHIRDILREINHRQVMAGTPANAITRNLQNQLVGDSRMKPIGRSGEWSLVEWKHISQETILELMQEFLHLKQTSATAREIYDYVHSKRESVNLKSIHAYLVYQKLFTRVADGKYGLAAWGDKPYETQRNWDRKGLDEQIDMAIKAIFTDEKTDKLPLWSTVDKVRERTGRAGLTIRKRISQVTWLKIEQHPKHSQRKLLKYLGENQSSTADSKIEISAKKVLIRDSVQNEVANFLSKQPENSAPLSVIVSHVMKKTGCIKPTMYHYLGEMENIRKEYMDGVWVCKLITPAATESPLSFTQIEAVTDDELKGNLKRAVSNLNIDNVDLGLFQLGKIFEIELKSFLLQAKSKNAFPVSKNDLERLANMIDCVERNKIITQKHHLTLLREHRNERAHGDVPNLAERKKLMQYAPFLGDLYITYIVLFNNKRQKL